MPPVIPVTLHSAASAALFDLDDTLIDHTSLFAAWAEEFAARYGIEVARIQDAERRHGGWRHRFFTDLKARFGIDASVDQLYRQYRRRIVGLVPHRDEVCTAVASLAEAGWRLGVVTNGDPQTQRAKLHASGLDAHFPTVIVSGEYGVRKPDPSLMRIALDDLGTHSGVMIGDRLDTDVAGAKRAGLRAIWIAADGRRPPRGPVPDTVVPDVVQAVRRLLTPGHVPVPARR